MGKSKKAKGSTSGSAAKGAAEELDPRSHPVIGFGRLIRVALAPSAAADIIVGIAIAHRGQWPTTALPWLLVPASLGIYHGAMALNDWSDRHEDAVSRPDRPIPSGSIGPGFALGISVLLILGGILWATAAGPRAGIWMAVVALLAVGYDLAGRGPLRGPMLLGLCRAGNLGAGLASPYLVGQMDLQAAPLLLPLSLLYGLHIFFISRLGRLEDLEDEEPLEDRPTDAMRGAGFTALAVPVVGILACGWIAMSRPSEEVMLPIAAGLVLSSALAGWNAVAILGRARVEHEKGWERASVGAATGLALRRLPMFTASIAVIAAFMGPASWVAIAFAILGAKVSGMLRSVFPLT